MGVVHLDAGAIIGLLDANDAHHVAAHRALASATGGGHRLALAASAFAECLVGPFRRGKASVEVVRGLIERLPIAIIALDAETAVAAAQIRAQQLGVRLPDALVIATAVNGAAEQLITTNRKWPTAKALKVKLVITQI